MMYQWINTLLVSGCICAFVLYICPEGKIKGLLEVGCASVMLLALISPLSGVNLWSYAVSLSEYRAQLERQEKFNQDAVETLSRQVIEQEYATYILSEASVQNVEIQTVEITAQINEDGIWIPYEAVYQADGEVPESFTAHITTQLGIPKERQHTYENTETTESVAQ